MEHTKTIEVLEQLEKRISRAVETVSALRLECRALRTEKADLEKTIKEIKQANMELSQQVNNIEIQYEQYASSFNREEVRKKIDHVLEKFGELQL